MSFLIRFCMIYAYARPKYQVRGYFKVAIQKFKTMWASRGGG